MLSTLTRVDQNSLAQIAEEMGIRKTSELFLLFALGSQFDHLIKQSLEKLGVFCLVADPASVTADDVKKLNPKGIILSGGPVAVYLDPPPFDSAIFDLGIPVLGICLGFQLWAQHIGAKVELSKSREYGVHELQILENSTLLNQTWNKISALQSHGDRIMPGDMLNVLASTEHAPVAAAQHHHLWGVQFHPEVSDTEHGSEIFENFCFNICHAKDRFPAQDVAQQKITELRDKIGNDDVLLCLSGGSDSSTCAYLLKDSMRNSKGKLYGLYIEGIDRPDDKKHVLDYFGDKPWIELIIADATGRFLDALKGITGMKEKRLAMRGVYKAVIEEQAKALNVKFIVQGTLYTDISESGGGYESGASKATIKMHHNVNLGFPVPELLPLADQVKDGGRNIGRIIGVPEELLIRHPFPGPGLLIRIDGEVTGEKLEIVRQADQIFIEELRRWNLYEKIWQAGINILNVKTTCSRGDGAFEGWVLMIWAYTSVNGFTARIADLPFEFLKHVDRRICNEIQAVGTTCNKLTDKPPATIEMG